MTFVSITFQKIVLKSFKQAIECLPKECNKIIHIISNDIWSIAINIAGNVNVIYSKKQIWKTLNSSSPSIEPCGPPNVISNQVYTVSILNFCSLFFV